MLNNKGFTLIELLMVILIIGFLSTMSIFAVNTAREKAKVTVAQHDIDVISGAMKSLAHDTALWPGAQAPDAICALGCGDNELCALGPNCAASLASSSAGITGTDGAYPNWDGPYMNRIPPDPWNHEYFFDTDYRVDANGKPCACTGEPLCSNAVVIGSYGPSSTGNGAYDCEEIIKILFP